MLKFVRYGLAIASLVLPLLAQAELSGLKEVDKTNSNDFARCDLTITSPRFASTFCSGNIQFGLYTVTNTSPVPILLQRIEIVRRDALLDAQTAILAAPVNNCVAGRTLAPGSSCNVLVRVSALAVRGTFNRVVRIFTQNTRQLFVDSSPITSFVSGVSCPAGTPPVLPPFPPLPVPPPVIIPTPPALFPPLCPLYQFAILGATTVTNAGPSVINGDLGVSPGTAVTGFPPGTVNGTIYAGVEPAGSAQDQAATRYTQLSAPATPCEVNLTGTNLGGRTLAPGVYCFNSSAALTGTLVLDGQGDPNATFVFQIGSTLTTASNSAVLLTGGATSNNVHWQIGSSATFGTETAFQGNVYALTSITMNTGADLIGRAVALNGAVTLDTNIVTRVNACPIP
ncbi:ice-binding family protein [Legionella jamestowniensis]|uniref:Protein with a bacterial immunoglobulin-like domain protein n=1 Tax=Legionella jamestowniensis TaxID=455 RepID=A0A0W0UNA1_9GAMM|nr:ice-binding family protein [Legionella jamestowniensis]KTD09355.1 hypothetical protein Ljam_0705 [Legionella jamestowniensis]SFL88011.1 Protein of unknown function [Legionella jamestowniensis DSM 19215]